MAENGAVGSEINGKGPIGREKNAELSKEGQKDADMA